MAAVESFYSTQTQGGDIECPPEDTYTLKFIGYKNCKMGQPFLGKDGREKPPEPVCLFEASIVATDPTSYQSEWHDFVVGKWMTLKPEYPPDAKYTKPALYLLTKALNGGTPVTVEKFTEDDDIVRSGRAPAGAFDIAQVMGPLIGRFFRCVIGPNDKGWPTFKGEPMPPVGAQQGRRRGAPGVQVVAVSEPEERDDDPGF